jgi:hypothetical protein
MIFALKIGMPLEGPRMPQDRSRVLCAMLIFPGKKVLSASGSHLAWRCPKAGTASQPKGKNDQFRTFPLLLQIKPSYCE